MAELAPVTWLIDDLVTTIMDSSPDELPGLYNKLHALASALDERQAEYIIRD